MPMIAAGVGLLVVCSSSSAAAMMMGGEEKEDPVVPKTPVGPSAPDETFTIPTDAVSTAECYGARPVSYTHSRAHETREDLVCRLLLEKKKKKKQKKKLLSSGCPLSHRKFIILCSPIFTSLT